MKLYFRIFIFSILFISSILHAENIDTLLNIYAQENDLSKKTKKEAAGTVIVYTKQDLERMQIKSLSELLKRIPFYSYSENKQGYADLVRESGFPSTSSVARVYINEREIISPFYGNSLGIISKFDMAHIDHIEIYTGVTSFDFGVEPANMVIRLYTKDPKREVGGQFKTAYGSNNSKENSISYADIFDDFSYYAYFDLKETNEDKIRYSGSDLSRDKETKHIFLSLQNDTNRLEYDRIEGKSDLFMEGIGGGDGSPIENKVDVSYNLLGWYSTYFDKKLSLSLDYIDDNAETIQRDNEPLGTLFINGGFLNSSLVGTQVPIQYDSYYLKSKERQISAVLKYKENIGKHNFVGGLQLRKKDFSFNEIDINVLGIGIVNVSKTMFPSLFNFTSEKVYSGFLEDTYSIDDNQAIVAAVKHDIIEPNGSLDNENLSLFRLGYIYSNEDFSFKTFLVSTESKFDPIYYVNFNSISKLNPQRDDSFKIEANWKKSQYSYGLELFKTRQINRLYEDYTGLRNLSKPYYTQGISFKNSFNIDKLNRVDTNFYVMNSHNKVSDEKDTVYGGYIRMLNTIGKFDLYNELIYRDGYEGIQGGYDFNSAITYKYSKDLSISLKGENIFDKALKSVYTTRDTTPPYSINILDPISATTRKFWITLEYRF
ncbi:MAG: hypothetical protein C0625_02445 [Arcobacter sp.]|nr:MAG: hypothetical protein C0625_02445 [Arcobacter sp.]